MNYYLAPVIGDGSPDHPYRPDIPKGVDWVGQPDADGYLLKTDALLDLPIPDLAIETLQRGLEQIEVEEIWKIVRLSTGR